MLPNVMRIFTIVAVLTSFVCLTTSQIAESDKLATYFWQKCQNVSTNKKIFDKIHFESGELLKEFSHAIQNLPQNKQVFCKENRPTLEKHFNSIATDLELCLLPKEKYLSEFMKKSFSEFLHFLCHNDGEYTNAFFKASASQCRSRLEASTGDELGKCFEKIFKPSGGYLSKKDLCDDMNTAKKCFDVLLDEKCPGYEPFKQLSTQFFKYVTTPCSSCMTLNFSVLLLIASVLITRFTH